MASSESIKELATALSKVQGQLTFAVKDSANPFFKSKYADLESVWDSCREALAKNGLAVIQMPGNYFEGRMWLITRLVHSSGEWIEQEMSIPVGKPDNQGVVKVDSHACLGAVTYMRRASLSAFLGIVQADDDGNTASGKITLDEEVEIGAAIEKMKASKTLAELKIVYATAYSKFKGNNTIVKVYEEMKSKCT
jgi:hypothetical protein